MRYERQTFMFQFSSKIELTWFFASLGLGASAGWAVKVVVDFSRGLYSIEALGEGWGHKIEKEPFGFVCLKVLIGVETPTIIAFSSAAALRSAHQPPLKAHKDPHQTRSLLKANCICSSSVERCIVFIAHCKILQYLNHSRIFIGLI